MVLYELLKLYEVKCFYIKNFKTKLPRIYIINLSKDVIKRNYIMMLMKKLSLNYVLVVVKEIDESVYSRYSTKINNISRNELGCTLSHAWCLNHFMNNSKNQNNCIVFEDDIIIRKQFISQLKNILDRSTCYDFLLLGSHDYFFSLLNYSRVQNGLYKPHEKSTYIYGAFATYYSKVGAQLLLDLHNYRISFFDKYHREILVNKENAYICYPNLVTSDINQSSLDHKHELLSKQEKDYYSYCHKELFNFQEYHMIYLGLLKDIKDAYTKIGKTFHYKKYLTYVLKKKGYTVEEIEIIIKRINFQFLSNDELQETLQLTNDPK